MLKYVTSIYLLLMEEDEFMALFLDDNAKNWIKNSADFYSQLLKMQEMTEEYASVYTLLIKSRNKNYFLESLYALANVETVKLPINEQDANIKKEERFKLYSNIRAHIEKLSERFKNDFLSNSEAPLKIGFLEIVCLEMIYYPEQTQKLFQLSHEKYCQLSEVLKEKVLSEHKILQSKENAKSKSNSSTSSLSKYGAENLTAQEFSYNPLVGNEQALRKATKILLGGDSLIILGEAGVGKTTLVNGIAYNIKMGNVPDILKNKKIIMIPISGIVANTEYVGTLEKHVNDVISYAKTNKDTIFYIDEIHMIMGAGQTRDNNIDISNLLKPYISNRTLQIIGATTLSEFDQTIATNPAFRRRFSTITLNEPTDEEVFRIAKQYISIKSQELRVEWDFNDTFLKVLVNLTSSKNRKHFETINNPNITLKIIDGMFASTLYYGRDYVDKRDVIESIQDNEILATTKKEDLIHKLSSDEFYTSSDITPKSKILTIYPQKI